MSKKKAFSGSTMTLKDFHGGSIPSDLHLPSAPGVVVRSGDRSTMDRQIPARLDHRTRPGSSGTTPRSALNEKSNFFSNPIRIGRNFDEDERKPLDAPPCRPGSAGDLLADDRRHKLNLDLTVSTKPFTSPKSSSLSDHPSPGLGFNGKSSFLSDQSSTLGLGFTGSPKDQAKVRASGPPNAWTNRKEGAEVSQASLNMGPSRLVNASALDKVSSGRWQSRLVQSQPLGYSAGGTDVLQYSEKENESYGNHGSYSEESRYGDEFGFREKGNQSQAVHYSDCGNERDVGDLEGHRSDSSGFKWDNEGGAMGGEGRRGYSQNSDDGVWPNGKEVHEQPKSKEVHEHPRSQSYYDSKERGRGTHNFDHGFQSGSWVYSDGPAGPGLREENKSGFQSSLVSEVSERPKLKLLPRTKPLEPLETQVQDCKQGYQQSTTDYGQSEVDGEGYVNTPQKTLGSAGVEGSNTNSERPKLNLKPRSQPLEKADENVERERKSLFGGARPRELVLKERGVDDVVLHYHDSVEPSSRTTNKAAADPPLKLDIKAAAVDLPTTQAYTVRHPEQFAEKRHGNRPDFPSNRHDQEADKTDSHRSNNSHRTDNWRNERQHQQQQYERRQQQQQTETRRKPVAVEPSTVERSGRFGHGKVASALELAQAFSSSTNLSDGPTAAHQRGRSMSVGPGRGPVVPFSRLTDTHTLYSGGPQHQINGY
ncbi:uncharacterized protein LOC18440970 [Amborella trichopoda]|uniref:Uncharacterized protein n=1 Tax=Amborella trichopoda TaxID=13333 RepID=W1PXM9_AMBTC|nr:uncharacterized protein LOC18440970 [Amborella trichopoda]ERN12744.1 hypothetical protein AMTR_s00043p00153480 [Amborella trichopoda]|eukprot:XP_006851163.1 uncharacterized protein LOC18440970 [Amborella trichopoda]